MLDQTVQPSGRGPEKRPGFALWPAAARTALETEAHKAATLCMRVRTSFKRFGEYLCLWPKRGQKEEGRRGRVSMRD